VTLLFQDCSGELNGEKEYLNHREPAIVDHLAFIAVKYNVFLAELYEAIVLARAEEKSVCEQLTIEYRGTIKNEAIFLITKAEKVIVQFRIPEDFLCRKNISFDSWMDTDKIRKQLIKQNPVSPDSTLIHDLRHGMKKVNLEAKVMETQKPQLIHTQYGNNVLLTNAVISDETGQIRLCLWGEQLTAAAVGDIVQIRNASVRSFKGERQLSLGRTGTITIQANKAGQKAPEITV
jgi:replication factor A1